jgi:hypothetical protein
MIVEVAALTANLCPPLPIFAPKWYPECERPHSGIGAQHTQTPITAKTTALL